MAPWSSAVFYTKIFNPIRPKQFEPKLSQMGPLSHCAAFIWLLSYHVHISIALLHHPQSPRPTECKLVL